MEEIIQQIEPVLKTVGHLLAGAALIYGVYRLIYLLIHKDEF